LEIGALSFEIVGKFLEEIKEFEEGENELRKVMELKKIEQGQQTIDEYIQMFKRVARGSRYKGRLLVKEFKREIDENIRRRLMEAKFPPKSINQWYKRAARLDRNCRESRREEEEKRSKIKKEKREEKRKIEKE